MDEAVLVGPFQQMPARAKDKAAIDHDIGPLISLHGDIVHSPLYF